MRPIDADFVIYAAESEFSEEDAAKIRWLISHIPTINAEPVRHMGKTTNIETDNLDVFGGRIIVTQGKFCRVYYEDESITHCKDCKHWGTGCGGETEHIKVCEYANYMVGENGYCVYGERKMNEEVQQ